MHAEDDRYAKFFLFTEKEVEILCANDRTKVCGTFTHIIHYSSTFFL